VSERCLQLLPQAAALERNEKLAALVRNPTAPPPTGLAGVTRFLQVVGDSPASRELYAELMHIHHRTVEAAEKNPRDAATQYQEFCQEAYNRYQADARVGRYSYDNVFSSRADMTFFLLLSADARVRKNDGGNNWSYVMLYGTQLTKAISDKDGSPGLRKLFLHWLENEPQTYMQQQGFQLAAQAGMKEALPVLLKMIANKDRDKYGKAQVMTALTKLGSKEHMKVLEPYLSDTTSLGTINFGNAGGGVQQLSVQLRDVAMGVQVQLSGQKLTEYGFDNRFGGGMHYYSFGFPDDASRDAAHKKWTEWRAKNLDKSGDPKAAAPKSPDPTPPAKK
jgi:hypothetical protein